EEQTNEKKIKTESTPDAASSTSTSTVPKPKISKIVSTATATTTKSTNGKTSIQLDPTTTDLYKNLFTTSDAAKKKEKNKAHWVTYNPLYF
ncbi:unnamed protein product, partial [Adineta steineri]